MIRKFRSKTYVRSLIINVYKNLSRPSAGLSGTLYSVPQPLAVKPDCSACSFPLCWWLLKQPRRANHLRGRLTTRIPAHNPLLSWGRPCPQSSPSSSIEVGPTPVAHAPYTVLLKVHASSLRIASNSSPSFSVTQHLLKCVLGAEGA